MGRIYTYRAAGLYKFRSSCTHTQSCICASRVASRELYRVAELLRACLPATTVFRRALRRNISWYCVSDCAMRVRVYVLFNITKELTSKRLRPCSNLNITHNTPIDGRISHRYNHTHLAPHLHRQIINCVHKRLKLCVIMLNNARPFVSYVVLTCSILQICCDELQTVMVPLPDCASGEWGPTKATRLFGLVPITHQVDSSNCTTRHTCNLLYMYRQPTIIHRDR